MMQPLSSTIPPEVCAFAYKFTGKERDSESGLDYFGARYYGSGMGRFMSPDPSGLYMADPENPQTLNLYSYVGNNPLRYIDPLGLSRDCGGDDGDPSVVCMVTSAWDKIKKFFSNSSNSNSSSSPSGAVSIDENASLNGRNLGPVADRRPRNTEISAPSNINCNTKLPNGKTVGDYVRAARTQMNSIAGTGSPPLDAYHMLTTFKGLVGGGSPIDFKNTMAGQASQELLGNAGNFAYYAIGSGYFSAGILDMGAGGYAIKSAFIPSSPVKFSSLTMPYGQDTSAKLQEGPGLAANGCGVKTF